MLTLFQLPGAGLCPSLSPPCLKLETWLRLTAVPYEIGKPDLDAAPKGKLPFIQDDVVRLGDSTLVLEHLRQRYGVDPDKGLDRRDRMTGLAMRRMLKEHFYWILVYHRWQVDAGYEAYRELLGGAIMPELAPDTRRHVVDGFRPYYLEQLRMQGMGRHRPDEVLALAEADLAALATFVEPGPWVFGDHPTTADATVYASMANVIDVAVDGPLRDAALAMPTLVAHTRRMQERFFPERSAA